MKEIIINLKVTIEDFKCFAQVRKEPDGNWIIGWPFVSLWTFFNKIISFPFAQKKCIGIA